MIPAVLIYFPPWFLCFHQLFFSYWSPFICLCYIHILSLPGQILSPLLTHYPLVTVVFPLFFPFKRGFFQTLFSYSSCPTLIDFSFSIFFLLQAFEEFPPLLFFFSRGDGHLPPYERPSLLRDKSPPRCAYLPLRTKSARPPPTPPPPPPPLTPLFLEVRFSPPLIKGLLTFPLLGLAELFPR